MADDAGVKPTVTSPFFWYPHENYGHVLELNCTSYWTITQTYCIHTHTHIANTGGVWISIHILYLYTCPLCIEIHVLVQWERVGRGTLRKNEKELKGYVYIYIYIRGAKSLFLFSFFYSFTFCEKQYESPCLPVWQQPTRTFPIGKKHSML